MIISVQKKVPCLNVQVLMPLNFGKITNDSILMAQVFIVPHPSVSMFWGYRLRHQSKFSIEEGIN